MLLKKHVERCCSLAMQLRNLCKKCENKELEQYYLGVYHACCAFLGKKDETGLVGDMEEVLELLRKESKNV